MITTTFSRRWPVPETPETGVLAVRSASPGLGYSSSASFGGGLAAIGQLFLGRRLLEDRRRLGRDRLHRRRQSGLAVPEVVQLGVDQRGQLEVRLIPRQVRRPRRLVG